MPQYPPLGRRQIAALGAVGIFAALLFARQVEMYRTAYAAGPGQWLANDLADYLLFRQPSVAAIILAVQAFILVVATWRISRGRTWWVLVPLLVMLAVTAFMLVVFDTRPAG